MRALPVLSVVIAMLATATPAKAAEQIFTPKGKWVVDYGADQCRAAREFVNGEKSVVLVLLRSESDDGMRLQIVGDVPNIRGQNQNITVTFLPNGTASKSLYYAGEVDEGDGVVMTGSEVALFHPSESPAAYFTQMGGRTRLLPEMRDTLTGVTVKIQRYEAITFQTGKMGPILGALEKCTDTLAVYWGFDDATEKSLTKRPEPSNDAATWIQPKDYPKQQVQTGGVATIEFRLNVETDGRVSECFITNKAGDAAFAKVVCDRMKERAQFSPALDKDGNPVRSFYINRVNFIMKPM